METETVGVRQARADFARIVDQADAGTPVVISRHGRDVAAVLPAAAVAVWQRHLAAEADRQRREAEAEQLGRRLPAGRDPVCPTCRSSYLHVVYRGPVVAALVNTADPDAGVQTVTVGADAAMLDGVAWVRCASCWEPVSDLPRRPGRPAHQAATTIADEKPWPPGTAWELIKEHLPTTDDGTQSSAIVLAHDLARGAVVRVTYWEWLTGVTDAERDRMRAEQGTTDT